MCVACGEEPCKHCIGCNIKECEGYTEPTATFEAKEESQSHIECRV
jgi:hypothetical protein